MGEHMTRRLATQRSAPPSVIMSRQGRALALLALGLCTQLAAARPGVLTSATQQVRSCLVACSVLRLHSVPVPSSPPPHTPVPASHTKRERDKLFASACQQDGLLLRAAGRSLLSSVCDPTFSAPGACAFTPLSTYPGTSTWFDGVYVPVQFQNQPRLYG